MVFHGESKWPSFLNGTATQGTGYRGLEGFQKYRSYAAGKAGGGGRFGFWLRFSPVTGRGSHAPDSKPCYKSPLFIPTSFRALLWKATGVSRRLGVAPVRLSSEAI